MYGDVEVDATAGANIDLQFAVSHNGSSVTVLKDNVFLSSPIGIALAGGTQSTISLLVLNSDSGVQLRYDIIVIRPLPTCFDNELYAW